MNRGIHNIANRTYLKSPLILRRPLPEKSLSVYKEAALT